MTEGAPPLERATRTVAPLAPSYERGRGGRVKGDRLPGRREGTTGYRSPAQARRAWERARSCPDNPSSPPSRGELLPLFPSRLFHRLSFSLSRSPLDSRSILRTPTDSPSRSRSRTRSGPASGPLASSPFTRGDRHRRESPITAERARSKAPRARVVIRPGVLSIWVIANANKDSTRRTIISRNYTAYREYNCACFRSASIMSDPGTTVEILTWYRAHVSSLAG